MEKLRILAEEVRSAESLSELRDALNELRAAVKEYNEVNIDEVRFDELINVDYLRVFGDRNWSDIDGKYCIEGAYSYDDDSILYYDINDGWVIEDNEAARLD